MKRRDFLKVSSLSLLNMPSAFSKDDRLINLTQHFEKADKISKKKEIFRYIGEYELEGKKSYRLTSVCFDDDLVIYNVFDKDCKILDTQISFYWKQILTLPPLLVKPLENGVVQHLQNNVCKNKTRIITAYGCYFKQDNKIRPGGMQYVGAKNAARILFDVIVKTEYEISW